MPLAPLASAGCLFLLVAVNCWPALAQPETESPELPPAAVSSASVAETPFHLPPAHHGWGHWKPGAWRTLRVTTETFDTSGNSLGNSVSTETEILEKVGKDHYQLESHSVVEVGGESLEGPVRHHRLQMLTDTADDTIATEQQPPGQINLDGRTIPCQVWRLAVNRGDRQLAYEVYYSDSVWPYVLRREIVETSLADTEQPLSTTQESVVRVQVPVLIDEQIVPGAHIHSTTETTAGHTERLEIHANAVPGGLVSKTTTEWDAAGRRIRWSTTEVVEFGAESPSRGRIRRLLRRGRQR